MENKHKRNEFSTTELLTPDELARMLKISKTSVYRLIDKRQIPFHKVMRSIRFGKNDVISYLEEHRIEPITLKQYGSKVN